MASTFIYSPDSREWLQWELLDHYLTAQGAAREAYDLAFVLHSNYDFSTSQIDSYIFDSATPCSVALGIYWLLQPEYWLEKEKEHAAIDDSTYESFKALHDNYLNGVYRQGSVAFDPVAYWSRQFGSFSVSPTVPEIFRQPTTGNAVHIESLAQHWDEGLPPEVWQNVQIFQQLDELAEHDMEITSPDFRDLVLKAQAIGLLADLEKSFIDVNFWLGTQARPLFDVWEGLSPQIWQPLTIIPAIEQRAFSNQC